MAAHLTIHGEALLADPAGALYWPARHTLVVADLHLEKASSLARRGVLLPPYDTRSTLDRLAVLVQRFRPQTIISLGDSFHDELAVPRLAAADAERLRRLARQHDLIWIAGNHDAVSPAMIGGSSAREIALGRLIFRHQPADTELTAGEIVGHFHPKAAVATRARRISAACYVTDGRRMVLPAFGEFTGGLDVLSPAISHLFGRSGFRVLLLGRERLHLFQRQHLVAWANGG